MEFPFGYASNERHLLNLQRLNLYSRSFPRMVSSLPSRRKFASRVRAFNAPLGDQLNLYL